MNAFGILLEKFVRQKIVALKYSWAKISSAIQISDSFLQFLPDFCTNTSDNKFVRQKFVT